MDDLYIIQSGVKRKAEMVCCERCDNNFLKRKNSKTKFCSVECANNTKRNRIELECFECGKKFERVKSKALNSSKHDRHFCSRKCKEKAQSLIGSCLEIRPDHYGTGSQPKSYRKKAFNELDKKCNKCGYDKYLDILQVHHKDKNRLNNNIENLEILCPNCHMEFHFLEKSGPFSGVQLQLVEASHLQ